MFACGWDADHPALSRLRDEGLELVAYQDGRALIEEVVRNKPNVVIYTLKGNDSADFPILGLLRRVAPDLPLVLLAEQGSLGVQRLAQDLRPIYYAVLPLEADELGDAVRAALARSG